MPLDAIARLRVPQARRLGLLLAAWLLAGCSAHRYRSALYLPCKPKEITVSEEVYSATEETWVAKCKGREYGCSARAAGNKVVYACKAMRRSAKRHLPRRRNGAAHASAKPAHHNGT